MAQRASLARALVNDPTLLILDEPLGKLDSLTRLAMQGELVRLWQRRGFTVLMVTHDVEEALLLSNRVIVDLGDAHSCVGQILAGLRWRVRLSR
jgi:NitT/TauT family transport system ATP-binding protein